MQVEAKPVEAQGLAIRRVVREHLGLRSGTGWLVAGLSGLSFLAFFLYLGEGSLREGAIAWYILTSAPNADLGPLIGQVAKASGIPLLAAFLFGLLGTTAPCQLSTNAAAAAYVGQRGADPVHISKATVGYLVGKLAVYGALGAMVLLLGSQAASSSVPVITTVRKALGPLMVLLGLVLLGLIRPNFLVGHGLSGWLQDRLPRGALPGGLVLGLAFGLAFCPTLFLLFFGLTMPLALASPYGILYPLLFAFGTTVPLIALAALVALGGAAGGGGLRAFATADRFIRPAAGVVLLLAGFNDTFVYWFL